MSEWASKRFWTEVTVQDALEGFCIAVDGRPVKTPAKRSLYAPTRSYAEAIAAEWDAQQERINPQSMPFTRSANAAIDKVSAQRGEVADMLAAYGDADLLCYRAERPQSLVDRQSEQWDPFLDWAAGTLDAQLHARAGVMHVPQDACTLDALARRVHAMSSFQLAGFHDLVSLSGSLILGFAAAFDLRSSKAIWEISRLDEIWQAEQWGADDEAEAAASVKEQAFIHAKQVFDLSTV